MKLNIALLSLVKAKSLPDSVSLITGNQPACIGCDDASAGQFPWQVSLQISKEPKVAKTNSQNQMETISVVAQ